MNTCGAPAGLLLPLTAAGVLAWALLQHANLAYATIWQAVRDPGTGSADGGIASSSAESCRPRCGFSGRRSGSLLRLSGSRTARPDERRAKGAFVVLVGPGEQSQQVRRHAPQAGLNVSRYATQSDSQLFARQVRAVNLDTSHVLSHALPQPERGGRPLQCVLAPVNHGVRVFQTSHPEW